PAVAHNHAVAPSATIRTTPIAMGIRLLITFFALHVAGPPSHGVGARRNPPSVLGIAWPENALHRRLGVAERSREDGLGDVEAKQRVDVLLLGRRHRLLR